MSLCSCVQTLDPCPSGFYLSRSQDRCVASTLPVADTGDDAAEERDAQIDASEAFDADPEDTSSSPDVDPAPVDAEPEAEGPTPDAEPACASADIERWHDLHRKAGLVALVTQCAAPCAADQPCSVGECVRAAAGIEHCEDCTQAEHDCTLSHCMEACSGRESDAECVACLCEADCMGRFERCAGSELELCQTTLFGREASPEDYVLAGPILLRQKSQTGGLRATPLDVSMEDWPVIAQKQFSRGFTHMVSFPLHGREYVLHHKSQCGDEPCVARISPVLRDGSFGHPIYVATWTRGFDEIEMFVAQGEAYLLRYKSGQSPADDEPPGTVLVDRLRLSVEQDALVLEPVYRSSWRTNDFGLFTSIEPFAVDGMAHLLLATARSSGELRILRGVPDPDGLVFETLSPALSWSPGWDIVKTLKVRERWYAFGYKSGRSYASDEPPGQVRIAALEMNADGLIAMAPPVYEAVWNPGLTHVQSLTTSDGAALVTHDAATGTTAAYVLREDLQEWPAALAVPARTQIWGFTPPWDVVEIAGQNKW